MLFQQKQCFCALLVNHCFGGSARLFSWHERCTASPFGLRTIAPCCRNLLWHSLHSIVSVTRTIWDSKEMRSSWT